jgi:UDP-N-acetylglucosamine--N-acetylmuramyl-(pentapeptide) pyrophosphoryl-undecaprenol N-acetylglucosamine transferase
MDNHQAYNVREMVNAGGARAIEQSRFTPAELAKQMQKLAMDPDTLQHAAERAKSCGRPDAARDMADLIESFGPAPTPIDTVRAEPEFNLAGLAGAAA